MALGAQVNVRREREVSVLGEGDSGAGVLSRGGGQGSTHTSQHT